MKTMTIQEIKIALILSGATVTGIARKENVSHSLVSQVLHGHRSTPRIRLAIAQAIGKQVSEIWPNTKMQSK